MTRNKIYKPGKALAATICIMVCLTTASSHAQVLTGLQNNLAAWQKACLHEKLYVHTNKNFYVTGEILWLKIYNTDGGANKMLDISKVAYVELLDNNHTAVMQAKIAMKGGLGEGSLFIPFSLSNGNYQLRAYTNWMKNFDAGYFFQKQIVIVNPVKSPQLQTSPETAAYDVQFFPEGGHLVKGSASKIAFKVTAPDGTGQPGAGVIVNTQNDTVVRFKTLKFGIGSFTFTPTAQTGYRAIIKAGNNVIVKELPEISASGYVMQTKYHENSWDVTVQNSDNKQGNMIYLVVHNNNAIKFAESATLINGNAHFNISKSKLDDGLSYVTLFDDHQMPVCERLIFKRPGKKLDINAEADAQMYNTRKKVSLTISTRNQDNKNLAANLSVSVFRLDSLQKEDSGDIAVYLWLSAGIKGHIESPGYYLDTDNDETTQALDNLMLSQGWTQFDWSKVLTGDAPHFNFLPEYTGPIIAGSIVNTLNNKPAENITAYVTIAGTQHQLYVTKSDSAGKLLFNTNNFYGPTEIIAQTKWQQDSVYRMDITSPFSEQYTHDVIPALNLNAAMKTVLIENSLNMQVQNIFAAKQLKQFTEPVTDSILFYGTPNYTYKLDDYTRFPTMEEVIHEYVRLVGITREHGKRGFHLIDDNKMTLPGQPLVILDGKPIFDLDKTFLIDPLKVKKLDVVMANYLYGPVIFNGILSFSTYNGISTNIELDARAVVLDYEGLQLQRKFYSPVYDSEAQVNSSIPDFRNALYWNPDADTDQQGQNKLSFYTGDKPGKYIGIIEGITPDGEAGSRHFFFEVKK